MKNRDIDVLRKKIKFQYWASFRAGNGWNYFISPLKYSKNDAWASQSEWRYIAEECIEKGTNILQALEIMLVIDFDRYFSLADEMVSYWYQEGGHDAYYYYDILAHFPRDHQIRRKIFGHQEFDDFLHVHDDYGQNSLARKALIRADDTAFKDYLGSWLNEQIGAEMNNDTLEDQIMPLLVELGRDSETYLLKQHMDYVKDFITKYLENDRKVVEEILENDVNVEYLSGRVIWVADNIGYWAWSMGWWDIIELLKGSEWYWIMIFSNFWDDENNNNLLAWSVLHDDPILKTRAIEIMKKETLDSIDGVIALDRMRNDNITLAENIN